MRLFLSSQDLGNFAEDLRQLVGDNRKTLLITNARDYAKPEIKANVVEHKLAMMEDAGFKPVELDLREYFSKDPIELETFVTEFNPGLVLTMGGSVFLLSTALAISGMDNVIRRRLTEDAIVYAGYSAGAMVASKDISNYGMDNIDISSVPSYYGAPAITNGLALIDEYIIPHADQEEYREYTNTYQKNLDKIGVEVIVLNNQDAYIVNGNHKAIKRAK